MRSRRKRTGVVGATVLAGALVASPPVHAQLPLARMQESLPQQAGVAIVRTLARPVVVDRDGRGVPRIQAESMLDAQRGLGFVHGQERFFQMDLARRVASGRLSELVGRLGVAMDRRYRAYQFEPLAERLLAKTGAWERSLLEAYAEGVNAGLERLGAPPPEYVVLEAEPVPWQPRDSALVSLSMAEVLNFDVRSERPRGVAQAALAPEVFAFFTCIQARFDALLLERSPDPELPPIPGPDVIDLRTRDTRRTPVGVIRPAPLAIGSNNWAVAGFRTDDGRAILANDPHLQLTVPGIWYHAQLEIGERRLVGLTLPGSPGIVIGSNGSVAWGMTNTTGDFQDLVVVEVDPDDPGRYRTPSGWARFETHDEVIEVRGGAPQRVEVRRTTWGIVTDQDWRGRPLVLHWTAYDDEADPFTFLRMMEAADVEDGVAIARAWGGPSQNMLFADATGRIAWAVSGLLPRRIGFDGTVPVSWAHPGVGWDGTLPESDRPVVVDPEDGLLFTANNRTVDLTWSRRIGNSFAIGARAQRIGSLLREHRGPFEEADLLAIQLDTRLELFDLYRDLIEEAGAGAPPDSLSARAVEVARAWDGSADVDAPAVHLLGRFRRAVHDGILAPLVAECRELDARFYYGGGATEEPVRRLLEARPRHLVPPGHADWSEFLRAALRTVARDLGPDALAARWGDVNRARVHHPLADGAPQFAALLNMPDAPLAGHVSAVRVATGGFGASARVVISPGCESDGILQIPAGQSGHPLSPHYRSGHADWLRGRPAPMLSQRPAARLRLLPE